MPLYEYECQDCGRRFEKIKRWSSSNPESIPDFPYCECGSFNVKRLLGKPGAVIYKGSGFYHTDCFIDKRGPGDEVRKC